MVRAISSACLAVAACVLVVLGVVIVWTDSVVLDTEGYVRVVAPLWNDSAVREKAAREIGQALVREVDIESTLREWYPDDTTVGRGQLAVAMKVSLPRLARGYADEYAASPAFESDWRSINTAAHADVLRQLDADGSRGQRIAVNVELPTSTLLVAARAPGAPLVLKPGARWSREVEVLDAGEYTRVRQVALALRGRAIALLGLAAVLCAVAVYVSARRRQTVAFIGLGSSAAMVTVLAAVRLARTVVTSRLVDWHLSPALTGTLYDVVTRSLDIMAGGLLLLGLAALGAALLIPRR